MAIRYIPPKRFIDTFERVTNEVMDLLGRGGSAIVEPETVRLADLDKDYAISQILAQVVGAHQNFTLSAAVTIPASTTQVLPDPVFFPTISSIDTVIWVEQRNPGVVLNPIVVVNPLDVDGSNPFEVKFIAVNHDIAPVTIAAGTSYPVYAFSLQAGQAQPKLPNAILKVEPGQEWIGDNGVPFNLPMTAGNLNASALPVVSIYQNSIGAIELNSADIGKLTENYSGLARQTLTVSLNHNIAPGPAVVIGTLHVPGAVAGFHVVQVGQVGLYPLYTGYVSATDTVVVTARCNTLTPPLQVQAGQKLKVFIG